MELIETNHVIFGKESDRDAVLQTLSNRVLELGYSNASKFAKAFYSVYGELPREYRKKRR